MFKKWKNPFKKASKAPPQPSAFDLSNVTGPPKAHHGAPQIPQSHYEGEVAFNNKVQTAGLHQMTIALEVWRPGQGEIDSPEIYRVPASRFLTEFGKDAAYLACAHNYSFPEFMEVFEEKLNKGRPDEPADFEFGRLGYLDERYTYANVTDQDDFGVALNNLYLNRMGSNVLTFVFQPELEALRKERLETDGEMLNRPVKDEKVFDERRASGPSVLNSKRNPFILADIPEGSVKRKSFNDSIALGEGPGVVVTFTDELGLKRAETHRTTKTVGSSASGKRASIGSIKAAVRKAVKGPVKKVDVNETREEQAERFKSLHLEEKIISFKRGGDDEEEEVSIRKFEAFDKEVEEGEAEEPENLQDEEDDEISDEDRIVLKLQRLQDAPELTQLNGTRWEECCAMFRCDPKATGIDEVITVAGLKTKIYQYQAFGVYWQMLTSRDVGGGFYADDMGLGKTLSFLAYFVVERQLSVLWREVVKSRATKDGKHLPEGQTSVCPSASKAGLGWIACPCSASSPTSKLAPQPGLRMACVPQALVGQWWFQWKNHVDVSDSTLALKIVVDHPATFNSVTATTVDRLASGETPQNRTRMQAEKYKEKSGKGYDTPKEYQEGYLLLTTKESFPKFAKTFEYKGQIKDLKKSGDWKAGTRSSLVFGIGMIDESHEEYFKNKGRAQILTNLPTSNNSVRPFVWGYSGTPFSQTPRGIEGVLWAIEKHSQHVETNFEWKRLDDICKEFDHQIKSGKRDDQKVEQILAAFNPFLLKFMIRRTAETKWFGHSLIKVKPHIHQDIILKPNERFCPLIPAYEVMFDEERDALLQELKAKWENFPESRRSDIPPEKLGFNTICRTSWRSRVLATFPPLFTLATMSDEASRLSLTVEEVQSFRNPIDKKELNTPYGKYIRQIVEGSPKCAWLYTLITNEIIGKKDAFGKDQKLVVMTNFPQVAFILKLFILRYFPEEKDRVGLIAGRMKASEKTELVNAFTDACDDKGNRKTKKDVRFLIGTSRLLGVGLQLTRACHAVLMEPDNEFVRELQAYARVHRIGQKNPLSRSYRLINSLSEIEQAILKRQEDRKEFAGRKLTEEEVLQIEKGVKGDSEPAT